MRRTRINLHSPLHASISKFIYSGVRVSQRIPLPVIVFITIALLGLTVNAQANNGAQQPLSIDSTSNSTTPSSKQTTSSESQSGLDTSTQSSQGQSSDSDENSHSQSLTIEMHSSSDSSNDGLDSGGAESQPKVTINGEEVQLPENGRIREKREYESDTTEVETKIKLDIDGGSSNTSINISDSSE